MYIEFLITLQTIFFGIFLYSYLNYKAQQDRLIRDISGMIGQKIVDYLDDKLDMDLMAYIGNFIKSRSQV